MGASGGRGFKSGEYVRISTPYYPFLKILSIEKKNENDKGFYCVQTLWMAC